MSIILKGNNINKSNNNDGIGPGEVTSIDSSQSNLTITLTWKNPSNVVFEGVTFSEFDHVVIVRKYNSAPYSIDDGTIVYTGNGTTTSNKNSSFRIGNIYYYRFFVYDKNGLCNNSTNMIYKVMYIDADPILANNSWDTIIKVSEAGLAEKYWKIGDEIEIKLSGYTDPGIEDYYTNLNISAQTITLQIWDFNHFDKSDGSGKAGICFGTKSYIQNFKEYMSPISKNNVSYRGSTWPASYIHNNVMKAILQILPTNIKNSIKIVNTYTKNDDDNAYSIGTISEDKVFIPGFTEIFGSTYNTSISLAESNQVRFPFFVDVETSMAYYQFGTSWLRSLKSIRYDTGQYYNYTLGRGGSSSNPPYSYTEQNSKNNVMFCFNI